MALNNGDYSVLMVSFEVAAEHESIILHKIMPRIKKRPQSYCIDILYDVSDCLFR
jgi:hypothetical protein